MATQITSLRADTGLPDVRNHFAFSDDSYFADGSTFIEFKGSQMAGERPVRTGRVPGAALRHIYRE